jgi:hypothetical protein
MQGIFFNYICLLTLWQVGATLKGSWQVKAGDWENAKMDLPRNSRNTQSGFFYFLFTHKKYFKKRH